MSAYVIASTQHATMRIVACGYLGPVPYICTKTAVLVQAVRNFLHLYGIQCAAQLALLSVIFVGSFSSFMIMCSHGHDPYQPGMKPCQLRGSMVVRWSWKQVHRCIRKQLTTEHRIRCRTAPWSLLRWLVHHSTPESLSCNAIQIVPPVRSRCHHFKWKFTLLSHHQRWIVHRHPWTHSLDRYTNKSFHK